MRILVAPDKFKGSLTAEEVCACIRRGIKKSGVRAEVAVQPMADGGEGSLELLAGQLGLERVEMHTVDPLGRQIRACYYRDENRAFVEMAAASGLVLLEEKDRNPMLTSTFGTGLMIGDALEKGMRNVTLFIGGSATNDAAMGVAAALGYLFLDGEGNQLDPVGQNLSRVAAIDTGRVKTAVRNARMTVICDVQNPFFGPHGAALVYAEQKGATPKQAAMLDAGMRSFAEVIQNELGMDIADLPGSGAAGGMGGGAVAFLGARLISGIDYMIDILGVDEVLEQADLVITGEGKIDRQTLFGKVVWGIARLAKKHQKPCIAFCGVSEISGSDVGKLGLSQIIPVVDGRFSLKESLTAPASALEAVTKRFFKAEFGQP